MLTSKSQSVAIFAKRGCAARPAVLRKIASELGFELFFLAFGAYPSPKKEREFEGPLRSVGASALFVGIPKDDPPLLKQFKALCKQGNNQAIGSFVREEKTTVWFEMTVSPFDYAKRAARRSPTALARLEARVGRADLPTLRAAKSLYVLRNLGRGKRTSSQTFMMHYAELLASQVDGVLGDAAR